MKLLFSISSGSSRLNQNLQLQKYQKVFCSRIRVSDLRNNKCYFKSKGNPGTPKIEELETVLENTPEGAIENEVFSWTKQWYPVQAVMNLDASRPTPVQLLGKNLVIWRDGDGNWACFEDECPHRLVPLSQGRLETDGTLQCAYHAWRFNGKGECIKIPQAEPHLEQKICSNKRSRAKTFPTQQKYGLLWVWGESGGDAHLKSLQKNPIVPPVIQEKNFNEEDWQVRDLPYSHKFLLENVIDPAHVTVSHHGSPGSDRNDARPIYMKLDEPMHAYKGFKLYRSYDKQNLYNSSNNNNNIDTVQSPIYNNNDGDSSGINNNNGNNNNIVTVQSLICNNNNDNDTTSTNNNINNSNNMNQKNNTNNNRFPNNCNNLDQKNNGNNNSFPDNNNNLDQKNNNSGKEETFFAFVPPAMIYHEFVRKDMNVNLITIATPTTKGKCRLCIIFTRNGKYSKGIIKKLAKFIPKWYIHLRQNRFFQQDNVFLFGQEKITSQKNMPNPITKQYFMPTMSDMGVKLLHKWFQMHGQGEVQYYPEMVPQNCSENDLIDTYNSHTKICTFCMNALKNFQRIQIGAWIACAICATCAICSAFCGAPMRVNLFGQGVVFPPLKFLGFGIFSVIFCWVGLLMNKMVQKFYKTEFCHADN